MSRFDKFNFLVLQMKNEGTQSGRKLGSWWITFIHKSDVEEVKLISILYSDMI